MEQLVKTSTPLFKKCPKCNLVKASKEFWKAPERYDGLRGYCSQCEYNYYQQRRMQTHHKYDKRYRETHKLKIAESHKRWSLTVSGRISRHKAFRKWYYSLKGLKWLQEYFTSGKRAEYERQRDYRIQEEAGYHHKVEVFYPGFRVIKALETAQVVEISG